MRRVISSEFIVHSLITILFLLLTTYYLLPTADAACTANTRADGLVTAKNLTGKFGTTATGGACVTGDVSNFLSYDIRDYAFLKSKYYTLTKATKTPFSSGFPAISDGVYLWTGVGDLNIPSSISGAGTGVIFTDGAINISNNINYGSGTSGLVLVAGGDINIASNVTTINAVLISSGTIYTADAGCGTNSVGPVSALIVNGSIVSLNKDAPPKFCRFLSNDTVAAETINQQPKYLVLLRKLFAETLQIWKELPGPVVFPSAPPSTSPPPSPSASPASSPTSTPPPTTWYQDSDNDTYGNTAITQSSSTQPAGYVANSNDCYDGNANAKPGQALYFSIQRGDSSFDYDCSGSSTPQYSPYCLASSIVGCSSTSPYSCYQLAGTCDPYWGRAACSSTLSDSSGCGQNVFTDAGDLTLYSNSSCSTALSLNTYVNSFALACH